MTSTLLRRHSFKSDRVILENISWHTYQPLLANFERSPAIRLTYDSGTLRLFSVCFSLKDSRRK